eukprot:TRINITY_DN3183_c0_g3_i3.p1 TRINITY_DN3183_c0_g3~~TRINITY_DN3183_c0_g3_i3.p1  ORF type:complete len:660 (+),score=173.64 TRINITY_DN3183_c0_g3_i3:94-2073(+)
MKVGMKTATVGAGVLMVLLVSSMSFMFGFQLGVSQAPVERHIHSVRSAVAQPLEDAGHAKPSSADVEQTPDEAANVQPCKQHARDDHKTAAAPHVYSYCLAVQAKEKPSTRALIYSLIDALALANKDGPRVNVTVVVADEEQRSLNYITDLLGDSFVTKASRELPFTMIQADMSDFDRELYRTDDVPDEGYTMLQFMLDKYFLYPDGGLKSDCHWAHFARGETVFSPNFLQEVFVSPRPVTDDDHLQDHTGAIDPKGLADVVIFSFVGMHPVESRDQLRRRHQVVHAQPKYGGVDLVSVMYRVDALLACKEASFVLLPSDPDKAEIIRKQGMVNSDWHMFKRLRKVCQRSHHVLPGVLAFKQSKEVVEKFPLKIGLSANPRSAPRVCLAVHTTEAESLTTEALLANIVAMVELTNPTRHVNVELKVILADASTEHWGSGAVPEYLSRLANLSMLKRAKRRGMSVLTPATAGLQVKDMARKDSDRRYVLSQRLLDDHIAVAESGDAVQCDYVMFIHNPRNRFNPYFLNETMVAPRPLQSSPEMHKDDDSAPVTRYSKLGDAILFDFIASARNPRHTALVTEAKLDATGVDVASVLYKVSTLKDCNLVKFQSIVDVVAESPELLLEPPQVLLAQQGWRFLKGLIDKCEATTSILPSVLFTE